MKVYALVEPRPRRLPRVRRRRRARPPGLHRGLGGARAHHQDLRQGRPDPARRLRAVLPRRGARRAGRRVLSVPRHRRHARGAQSRCPAGVRRAARPRRVRHDADPARAVRRILPAPDRPARPAPRRAGGGRHQRPPHAAALRDRGEHRRHPPRPGDRAAGGLPAARHEPDRRCHRERHLPLAARRAQAARAVHRGARRLLGRAPAPLHRDRARARPALHPADQLPALRRALRRVRRARDRRDRRVRELRRARRTWSRRTVASATSRRAGAGRAICRRCPPTT